MSSEHISERSGAEKRTVKVGTTGAATELRCNDAPGAECRKSGVRARPLYKGGAKLRGQAIAPGPGIGGDHENQPYVRRGVPPAAGVRPGRCVAIGTEVRKHDFARAAFQGAACVPGAPGRGS